MDFSELMALTDRASLDGPLGGSVTYTPGVGSSETVRGIFDAVHQLVDAGTPGVSLSGPVVFLLLEDLPSDPEEDLDATVTVGSTEYSFREVQKDGQGGVRILLHKVS